MISHPVIVNLDGILLGFTFTIYYKFIHPTLIADFRDKVSTIEPTKLHDFGKIVGPSEKTSFMIKLCDIKNTDTLSMLLWRKGRNLSNI